MRVLFYCRGVEQLGIEYIMSYLEQNGHEVELIFDPGLENNLYYNFPWLKIFNNWKSLIQKAVEWKPDCVAFSVPTNIYPFALEFAKQLKKKINVPFVFGGYHPTILPEEILKHHEIDYVIRGEGEVALNELISSLQNKKPLTEILNLCYRDLEKIRVNPIRPLMEDLDSLPFPKKDNFYKYHAFKNQLSVITSRGCFFKCTYCINNFYKNKLYKETPISPSLIRRRSPGNIIQEIQFHVKKFPIKKIWFVDEVFISSKPWLFEFLDLYNTHIKLPFSFSYHSRFIDEETVIKIAKAGGEWAEGGIETGDLYLRKKILHRTQTDEEILNAINLFKKHKIKVANCVIMGIPGETQESRWKTVHLLEKCSPDMLNTFIMYPFPGTEICDIAVKSENLNQQGIEKSKLGESSYHQRSLFNMPDIGNAETMTKLLPLYIRGPQLLKPFLKKLMKGSFPKFSHGIYLITAPFIYSGMTVDWMKDLIRILFSQSFKLFKKVLN